MGTKKVPFFFGSMGFLLFLWGMKVIHIPQLLNQVTKKKTLVGKLQVLYVMKDHALYPHLVDMIAKLIDMDMRGLHTPQDTLEYIDEICLECINNFKNPPKVKKIDPQLPF